ASSVSLSYPSINIPYSGISMGVNPTSLTAAQPQATVTFQSGLQVAPGTYTAPLTGTLGAQVASAPVTLNVTSPAKSCSSLTRSAMRRTDAVTTGVVYDPVHKLVFAAVQQTNTVDVFSAATA